MIEKYIRLVQGVFLTTVGFRYVPGLVSIVKSSISLLDLVNPDGVVFFHLCLKGFKNASYIET